MRSDTVCEAWWEGSYVGVTSKVLGVFALPKMLQS